VHVERSRAGGDELEHLAEVKGVPPVDRNRPRHEDEHGGGPGGRLNVHALHGVLDGAHGHEFAADGLGANDLSSLKGHHGAGLVKGSEAGGVRVPELVVVANKGGGDLLSRHVVR